MANPEHVEILKQGVDAWNRWREDNHEVDVDLSEINLSHKNLSWGNFSGVKFIGVTLDGAKLSRANFSGANLFRARLIEADLFYADLSKANFSMADLRRAHLFRSDLSGATLHMANLRRANLRKAILIGADFSETDLTQTKLADSDFSGADLKYSIFSHTIITDVDFKNAKNLEKIKHGGPSHIGINTIYRSQGNIPASFLRGCGVPENFIQYISSQTGKAFDFYSCFISYSTKNQDFADRLHVDLQNKGVRCWFAPEDMKIGDKIRDRIDQSIKLHDKLLLVLSEHSINSKWVEDEVESAYEQEQKRKKTVLFPIRLDDAVMDTDKAWAANLRRSRNIGDFKNWKDNESYQKAFNRLLRDLKADPE